MTQNLIKKKKKKEKDYTGDLKSIRDTKHGKVPNQTLTKINNNLTNLYEGLKI